VLVFVIATIFAVGGLVIFSVTAEQADFWRRGYRFRQLSPNVFFSLAGSEAMCLRGALTGRPNSGPAVCTYDTWRWLSRAM
jgi:hypothetical protein